MPYPIPENEPERLAELHQLDILDTEAEAAFDRVAHVAQRLFGVEKSALSLVDDDRQWFKAACGWETRQTPRNQSLCAYAVAEEELLVVEDLENDDRFAEHFPNEEIGIRFYAGAPLTLDGGHPLGTICVADPRPRSFDEQDRRMLRRLANVAADLIDARQKARQASYLSSALEQAEECIMITEAESLDPPGPRIRWVNGAYEDMTGYARKELIGRTPRMLQGPKTDRDTLDRVRDALENERSVQAETVNYRKDGQPYVVSWTIAPVCDADERLTHWVSVQRDVTAQRLHEKKLEYEATHDDLTGLCHRTVLEDHMDAAFEDSGETAGALFYIDLDRFKQVNDSLGHSAGDELLRKVADTLERGVRADDVVARIGGDEFVVWLPGLDDEETTHRIAQRLNDALEAPFRVKGEEVYVTASIGVVPDVSGYDGAESVLQDADVAMYRGKDQPGGTVVVHGPAVEPAPEERLELDTALRRAVEREAFEPYFQPIVNLDDGSLHGYEVLARWRRRDGTVVSPTVFLEVAEKTGLIVPIGHQVIEKACRVLRDPLQEVGEEVRVVLSGNFSREEFFRSETRAFVADLLDRHEIPPSHFTIEVTERVFGRGARGARDQATRLKELGVRMEVDDFGTGFASLLSLIQFPVDGVKIDKELTAHLDADGEGRALVQSVLELAERLQLSVTAEGIETPAQLRALRELGCPLGQGFLMARPGPADQLPRFRTAPWRRHWPEQATEMV